MYHFSIFKHCACQSNQFQPNKLQYIVLRSTTNTVSIDHIKCPKFKNWAGMPIIITKLLVIDLEVAVIS